MREKVDSGVTCTSTCVSRSVGLGGGDWRRNGGADNDTYQLGADTTDTITDGAGIDTIGSTITRSLAGYATIENLVLQGTDNIKGTGNGLANLLVGNSGRNRWTFLVEESKQDRFHHFAFDRANASYAAFVPAGTPKEVVAKLETALLAAIRSPQVRTQLDRVGLESTGLPGAEVKRIMDEDRAYWRPIVKASGFTSED